MLSTMYKFPTKWPCLWRFNVTQEVKSNGVVVFCVCDFLLVFKSDIWLSNAAPLWHTGLHNLNDLDAHLWMSLKATCDGAILLHIVDFLFVFSRNIWRRLFYQIYDSEIWVILTLTFQGHLRLNLIVSYDSPYMVSCYCAISNKWSRSAPIWETGLQNLSNLEFDLSKSLKE